MKTRKMFAAFLAMVMVFSLIPAVAMATGKDEIKNDVILTEGMQGGKAGIAVEWKMTTGTVAVPIANIEFTYDRTIFDLIDADGNVLPLSTQSPPKLNSAQLIGYSAFEFANDLYAKAGSGNYAYVAFIRSSMGAGSVFATGTVIGKCFLAYKTGKSAADVTPDALRLSTYAEADVLGQSAVIYVSDADANEYQYGTEGGINDTAGWEANQSFGTGFTFAKPAIAGEVSVTGTPKIGEPLSVDVNGVTSDNPGTLTYNWYYSGAADTSIGTGSTYTPAAAADVGKVVCVDVSAANCSGVLTGTAGSTVAKKDGPSAPAGLAAVSKTDTTITVTANSAWEYTKDNGITPLSSNVITGLSANTPYNIQARVKETATQEASAWSAPVSITTSKAPSGQPEAPAVESKTDASITVTGVVGQKYICQPAAAAAPEPGDTRWGDVTTFTGLVRNTEYKVYTYIPESTSTAASAVASTSVVTDRTAVTDTLVSVGGLSGKTYNAVVQEPTFGGSLTASDYTVAYAVKNGTGSLENGKPIGAGTYTVTISGTGNYKGSFEKEFTIGRLAVTITPTSGQAKTYGAADPTLTYTTGLSGELETAFNSAKFGALSRMAGSDVGSNYPITIGSLSAGSDFILTLNSTTVNFSITAKDVTETRTPSEQNIVQGIGNFTKPTFDVTGGAPVYSYGSVTNGSYADVKAVLGTLPKNTTGTIAWTYTASGNYSGTITGSIQFTVVDIVFTVDGGPASTANALTVKAAPVYGDTWETIVSKKDVTITASVGSSTDTDQSHFRLSVSGTPSAGSAQEYKLLYSGTVSGKTYTDVTVCSGTVDVERKQLTQSGTVAENKIYDGERNATVILGTISGILDKEKVTVTPTGTFESKNVGMNQSVTISFALSGSDATNYKAPVDDTVMANITAKPITIAGVTATARKYAKNNRTVALTGGVLSDVLTKDRSDVNFDLGSGTIATADAASGKAVATNITLTGIGAGNYALTQPTDVTVDITKADAISTLTNQPVSCKFTAVGERTLSIASVGMPDDAGLLTYTAGTAAGTVSLISSWTVDSAGLVTYTLSGTGSAAQSVTLPVKINSTNYAESTVNVVITLTAKDIPTGSADPITVTYTGSAIPAARITGTMSVPGTWSWKGTPAVTNVADSGTKTVVFTPTDFANYAEVEKDITVTISKATPTGTPAYTAITTSGKTLADAALTIGTLTPGTEGYTLNWVGADGTTPLAADTVVTENTAYKWLFTPKDIANYQTKTGSITLYKVSTGGGGGGGSSASSFTLTFNTNGGSALAAVTKTSGTTIDLTGYLPVRAGYEFDGWYSNASLTTRVTSVKLTANTTIYAKWTAQTVNPFTDVKDGAYYYDAVLWAVGRDVTSGTSATTFSPAADCTRGQVVTFLWRAMGSPEPKGTGSFSDVNSDAYCAKAVQWATEQGITNGTGADTFSPGVTVTRGQFVTFLWRAAGSPAVSGTSQFTDVTDANAYDYSAVLWAAAQGITQGTGDGTTFSPAAVCSRGQIVTFLYRYLGK